MKALYDYLFCILLVFCFGISINAQGLIYNEKPDKAASLSAQSSADQILIIIESELELEFSSSMERIENIIKEGKIYKFNISERVCVINIKEEKSGSRASLPFGQLTANSFPPLRHGEIRYFEIYYQKRIFVMLDESQLQGSDSQMLHPREALLIINTDPVDLNLDFTSSIKLTEIKKDRGSYRLFISPENQIITVLHNESGLKTTIQISDITIKEVRYYFVYLQDPTQKVVTNVETIIDRTIAIGSYIVETIPPGAIIDVFGNPSFNRENNKTPYRFDGYMAGPQVITLKLSEYEEITDTIQIGVGKANRSSYKLVPKFSFLRFNISPSPPYSKIYIDGREEPSIYNNSNLKVQKGDKVVEIVADHYYPENMIITTLPGQTHPVNVALKPIMGQIMLSSDQSSTDANVFISNPKLRISEKNIGKLPFRTPVDLQEGDYTIRISKKGYGTYEDKISIKKDQQFKKQISLVNAKNIILVSNVRGTEISINGRDAGKTNLKLSLGIGKHQIIAKKENYRTYEGEIVIREDDVDSKEHFIELTPMMFEYKFDEEWSLWSENRDAVLYVNDGFVGKLPKTVNLQTGKNKIYLHSTNGEFTGSINVPTKRRNIVFPLYKNICWGLGQIDFHSYSFGSLTLYGIKINAYDSYFFGAPKDYTMSGYLKVEGRVGGGLTRRIDVCFFGNYNQVRVQERIISGRDTTYLAIAKGTYYSYGVEIQLRPNFYHFYIRGGFYSTNIDYEFKGIYRPKNQPFITVGASFAVGDNIFRLWKKPVSHMMLYSY